MVCTESTSGVEIPERIKEIDSKRIQLRADEVQPILKTEYTCLRTPVARSRTVAISGNKPTNQNKHDTEK
ncbi:hypothetical protein D3C73_1604450 [compost metagenome]